MRKIYCQNNRIYNWKYNVTISFSIILLVSIIRIFRRIRPFDHATSSHRLSIGATPTESLTCEWKE
jgi:hypothetical protein